MGRKKMLVISAVVLAVIVFIKKSLDAMMEGIEEMEQDQYGYGAGGPRTHTASDLIGEDD